MEAGDWIGDQGFGSDYVANLNIVWVVREVKVNHMLNALHQETNKCRKPSKRCSEGIIRMLVKHNISDEIYHYDNQLRFVSTRREIIKLLV